MGQLVHRVRLGDVHAKLAMMRGWKRQNQVSIIIHQTGVPGGLVGHPRAY